MQSWFIINLFSIVLSGWMAMPCAVQPLELNINDLPEDVFSFELPTFYNFVNNIPIRGDRNFTMTENDLPELIIRNTFDIDLVQSKTGNAELLTSDIIGNIQAGDTVSREHTMVVRIDTFSNRMQIPRGLYKVLVRLVGPDSDGQRRDWLSHVIGLGVPPSY